MIAGILRRTLVSALAAPVAILATPALHAQQTRAAIAVADSFPHARHSRLFTSCASCHGGIASGDSAQARPPSELCANCHDGSLARLVSWTRRPPRSTNLRFDHGHHFDQVPGLECGTCHASGGDTVLMNVGAARPDQCMVCHQEGEAGHLAQETCSRCHVPLAAASRLSLAEIARLPKPPSHDSAWVWGHADRATSPVCATCHTRDFCSSCHVNARAVAPIQALALDRRVAALVRNRRATYPVPAFHLADGFFRTHGLMARADVAPCANCHARESCLGCHRAEERVAPVAALPSRRSASAYGVELAGIRPPDHTSDHRLRHRVPAAGGDATCSRCHAPTFCSSCHDAARAPGFHGVNFVSRHAQSAYTRDNDCAACHQTQAFCRSCHRTTGQSSGTGAAASTFHDTQPQWALGHGAIARRAIETCATCHTQSDCLKCHSSSTGQKVNPHGPGFNPAMGNKNPAMCRMCHVNGPPQ